MKRRRYPRFILAQGWSGELRTFQDVTLALHDERGMWVTSTEPLRTQQRVIVAFETEEAALLEAKVIATVPRVEDGVVLHRTRLQFASGERRRPAAEPTSATLWHATPATVVEVSRRGACIETPVPIEPGRVAMLCVQGLNHCTVEGSVRIAWSGTREGAGSLCRTGVELLPPSHHHYREHQSLRDLLMLMETPPEAHQSPEPGTTRRTPATGDGGPRRRTGTRRWRDR